MDSGLGGGGGRGFRGAPDGGWAWWGRRTDERRRSRRRRPHAPRAPARMTRLISTRTAPRPSPVCGRWRPNRSGISAQRGRAAPTRDHAGPLHGREFEVARLPGVARGRDDCPPDHPDSCGGIHDDGQTASNLRPPLMCQRPGAGYRSTFCIVCRQYAQIYRVEFLRYARSQNFDTAGELQYRPKIMRFDPLRPTCIYLEGVKNDLIFAEWRSCGVRQRYQTLNHAKAGLLNVL